MIADKVKLNIYRYLSCIALLLLLESCRSIGIYGTYCGYKNGVDFSNLMLKDNQEYIWQDVAMGMDMNAYIKYQTGPYLVDADRLTLIIHKEGKRLDSLSALSKPDTFYATIENKRIVVFDKSGAFSKETFIKSRRCKKDFLLADRLRTIVIK